MFSARLEGPESSPLAVPDGNVASISPSGELAMLTGRMYLQGMPARTLAASPAGGAPREVAVNVLGADWAPDGRSLAVVRMDYGGAGTAEATTDQWVRRQARLEFPIGKVLYESASSGIWVPRVSPNGDQVAFVEERPDRSSIELVDLAGRKTTLSSNQEPRGLAWSPKGDEVWFAEWGALWAVSLTGNRRLVARFPGAVTLNDISRDGRVLLTLAQWHASLLIQAAGETGERDLSWFDGSQPAALSRDGGTLLFTDRGGAGSPQDLGNAAPTCGEPMDRRRSGSGKAVPRRSRRTGNGSSP